MNAFFYGAALQFKLDMRSKTLLITCYVVPLLFFAIMSGIFTSLMPESEQTLIPSMTVMGVSMGALIGMPPSLTELYRSDIRKMYTANGIPLYFGLISIILSAFFHLLIMSAIIFISAAAIFDAAVPSSLLSYFGQLVVFLAGSLCVGSVLGLLVKSQSKLTMISQLVFLPSIMLSGIMFPVDLLPKALEHIGKLFPAAWGYKLLIEEQQQVNNLIPLLLILFAAIILCGILLKKLRAD